MARNVYTVKQVNSYIKNMFTQDFMLNRIYVKGEVSNCKYHTSGHIYFSLKDESGTIACVMFAGQRGGLSFHMREGQQIIVLGSVNVYERTGSYQLYAQGTQTELYLEQIEGATEKDMQYISQKAQKIIEKIDEIDTLINEHTTGWKTGRMNKVDLTILRLAVYEMKWDEDVPTGVAINEAVNLAKKYSSEDGASFVNGVLAKLAD